MKVTLRLNSVFGLHQLLRERLLLTNGLCLPFDAGQVEYTTASIRSGILRAFSIKKAAC